jgi:hypothetical protein
LIGLALCCLSRGDHGRAGQTAVADQVKDHPGDAAAAFDKATIAHATAQNALNEVSKLRREFEALKVRLLTGERAQPAKSRRKP